MTTSFLLVNIKLSQMDKADRTGHETQQIESVAFDLLRTGVPILVLLWELGVLTPFFLPPFLLPHFFFSPLIE